jgi:hypothetical protein
VAAGSTAVRRLFKNLRALQEQAFADDHEANEEGVLQGQRVQPRGPAHLQGRLRDGPQPDVGARGAKLDRLQGTRACKRKALSAKFGRLCRQGPPAPSRSLFAFACSVARANIPTPLSQLLPYVANVTPKHKYPLAKDLYAQMQAKQEEA